jgi:hypothetical protein
VLKAADKMGFEVTSPIQTVVIPVAFTGYGKKCGVF